MKFSNINLAVQSAAAPQSAPVQAPTALAQLPPEAMGIPQPPAPVPAACQPQLVPPAPAPMLPPEAMAMPPFPETPLPPPPPFMDGGYGQVPPPPAPRTQTAPRGQTSPAPSVQSAPAPQSAPRTQYGKKPRTPDPRPAAPAAQAPGPVVNVAPIAVAPAATQVPWTPPVAASMPQADSAAPMSALVQMAKEYEICKDFLSSLSQSKLCPSSLRGMPRDIFIVIQQGMDVGLPPLQALQSLSIINGKVCMYGDGMLALCMPHGDVQESFDEQKQVATCTCRRPGKTPVTRTFSLQEAMDAGLVAFDKDGHALGKSREGWTRNVPWGSYTKRMLQMRARGFALRDAFPDVLKGIISAEEAMDYRV